MADLKQGLFHTSRPAASISHLPDVRDEALDALRGIAALVVVLCHLFLAFAPAYTGLLSHTDPTLSWIGKPWYGLINGTAAVIFFFVLSGFVLSRKHLGTRTGGPVIAGMLKRWPRLAGPVVISCVFAWVIYALDGYRNAEAATAAGSSWLATIAPTGPTGQSPTFWGAIAQGAFGTFFQGTTSYNQVLWSMRWELYGSFVAFALALALMHAHESRPRALLILGSTISLGALSPGLAAFPIGWAWLFSPWSGVYLHYPRQVRSDWWFSPYWPSPTWSRRSWVEKAHAG